MPKNKASSDWTDKPSKPCEYQPSAFADRENTKIVARPSDAPPPRANVEPGGIGRNGRFFSSK